MSGIYILITQQNNAGVKPMSDFFSADPHFWHKNIIAYEKRPFDHLDHMHETIVNNHNSVVTKKDNLFLLGDVTFGSLEQTKEVISRMNGKIILIKGNHDYGRSNKWFLDVGFSQVIDWPILYNDFFILSHAPVYVSEQMPYVNIHGHLHKTDWTSKRFLNVGVDNWDFTPVSFDQVKKYFGLDREEV